MKKLYSIFLISLISTLGIAQESSSEEVAETKNYTKKYFIATNSGIEVTPVGFRIGFLDKRGAYIGARFGKGNNYETDDGNINKIIVTEATMVSATIGLILPVIYSEKSFKAHTFFGIGYGHWFNRLPKNSTRTGLEFECGFMFSYNRLFTSLGANFLMGDGNSPKKDLTVGIGYRFQTRK